MNDFLGDVLAGLSRSRKSLPSKYLYDKNGSALFEQITTLPEYYPTRVELALLQRIAPELSREIEEGAALVEFGSGSSRKTILLLDAAPQLRAYAPVDISPEALNPAAAKIRSRFPNLLVVPIVGDFTQPLTLPADLAALPHVGFFPGSTIGNFEPPQAVRFLTATRDALGASSRLIVGFDLIKDPKVLVAAYDDGQGVTAAFNLNLLARVNRELGGDFNLDSFAHKAAWNEPASRMEMHLVSLHDQEASVGPSLFTFSAGESIHTESSHKYTRESFAGLAAEAGWRERRTWTTPAPTAFATMLLAAD